MIAEAIDSVDLSISHSADQERSDVSVPLVDRYDPILRKPAQQFPFETLGTDGAGELAVKLAETMLKHGGLGLAAPQIGVPYQAFVIAASPILVIFNPKIVYYSDQEVEWEEGCLSFPQMFFKVKRPLEIRMRYQMATSEVVTEKMTGLTARIAQHEYDHLHGKLFIDGVSKLKIQMEEKRALKRIKEL
jgi:peptide deformylase